MILNQPIGKVLLTVGVTATSFSCCYTSLLIMSTTYAIATRFRANITGLAGMFLAAYGFAMLVAMLPIAKAENVVKLAYVALLLMSLPWFGLVCPQSLCLKGIEER